MPANRFYYLLLLFFLGILGFLTYEIVRPFLNAIAWAVVFSIVFYPVYAFLARKVRVKSVASLATIILMVVVILGPLTYVTMVLVKELQVVASAINENQAGSSLQELLGRIKTMPLLSNMRRYLGIESLISEETVIQGLQKLGKTVIENLSLRIPNIISGAIDFLFMTFTAFFLLKDGPGFLARIKDFMPFDEKERGKLASQVKDMIVSTVYGGVVIALIQGLLGGLAFYLVGIESPVLWGVAMSIMSFVPLLGTFAIWGPAAAYLLLQGEVMQGIGLLLFGVFVISMVDNILKPLIIGSRTKMHTILILFSVLGGIKLFGLIGLIMGPLITALFISVFDIVRKLGEEAEARFS